MKKFLTLFLFCWTACVYAQTAPAFVISELSLINTEAYMKDFAPKAREIYAKYGGTFIVGTDKIEGVSNMDKTVTRVTIAKFDSFEKAQAMINSPERKELQKSRAKYGTTRTYIVEGK